MKKQENITKNRIILVLATVILLVSILSGCSASNNEAAIVSKEGLNSADKKAVEKIIQEAYIDGVHINYDVEAMKKGFDKEFIMFAINESSVEKVTLDKWMDYISQTKKKNPEPEKNIKYEIPSIDIVKDTAVARVEIYKAEKHIYTDFLSLYKVNNEWKIVGKVYCHY
jgi:hypothetical protein